MRYIGLYQRAFTNSLKKLVPEVTEKDLIKGGAGVRAQFSLNGDLLDDLAVKRIII